MQLQAGQPPTKPEIIIFGPPSVFRLYAKQFSEKFRILKHWESSIPLKEFLSIQAQHIQAAICHAGFKVDSDILRFLPSLRLLLTTSAGLNHINLDDCRRSGVLVANSPTIFSVDVADLAVGLLMDVLRKMSAANRFVKSGNWAVKGGEYPLGTKVLPTPKLLSLIYFLTVVLNVVMNIKKL